MIPLRFVSVTSFLLLVNLGTLAFAQQQIDPQEMMRRMREHATPGPQHELMEQMLGEWKTETVVSGMPATAGTAEFKWTLGKRFMQQTYTGEMLGMPYEGIGYYGYDNYKKKFTGTWMDSISTTKNHGEGVLDQTGKIISFYGTMDEYLTGEHDKPVKYLLDLSARDQMVFEIHDLVLGKNSLVIQIKYSRKKTSASGWEIRDFDNGKRDR